MIDENKGAWSMLEQSVTPQMPTLEDLDPEVVANNATAEAMGEEQTDMSYDMTMQPTSKMDMRKQLGSLLKQQTIEKCARSKDFQSKTQMANRSLGK